MAISKKSLGKVLAISMASAMAMSSLSAALVSVSAVSPAALASNGNVQLNQDAVDLIQTTIGADDDNHLDAVQGGTFDLTTLKTAVETAANNGDIVYTDSDGQEYNITKNDITEISFKTGNNKLSIDNNNLLSASERATGSSSLQITIKAKFDLGAGKTKTINNIRHTVDVDIHEDGEYDLVAYKGSLHTDENRLTKSDLNELATYDIDKIEFTLIQYQKSGTALKAELGTVKQGTVAPGTQASASSASVAATFKKLVQDYIKDNAAKAYLSKVLEDAATAITGSGATILGGTSAPAAFSSLSYQSDAVYGFKYNEAATIAKPSIYLGQQDLIKDLKTANSDGGTGKLLDDTNDGKTLPTKNLAATTLHGITGHTNETLYITGLTGLTAVGANPNTEVDLSRYFTEVTTGDATKSEWELNTTSGEITASASATTNKVTVWAMKSDTDIAALKGTDGITRIIASNANYDKSDNAQGGELELMYKYIDKVIADNNLSSTISKVETAPSSGEFIYYEKVQDGSQTRPNGNVPAELSTIFDTVVTTSTTPIVAASTETISSDDSAKLGELFSEALEANLPSGTPSGAQLARIYATSGDNLFTNTTDGQTGWGSGRKGVNGAVADFEKRGGILFNDTTNASEDIVAKLKTNGKTGSATIEVAVAEVSGTNVTKIVNPNLSVKVVKAVDFGTKAGEIKIDRSGSKTIVESGSLVAGSDNINGFEVRGGAETTITIDNGTLGNVKGKFAAVNVNGGRVGTVDAEGATVTIETDGTAGDIIDAATVEVNEGGRAGKITSGNVTLEEGIIAGIDTDGTVTLKGGTVNGDVRATGEITITCNDEDGNQDLMDTVISGNVLGSGDGATVLIENTSENGEAEIRISGNVIARFVDTDTGAHDDYTVKIGSADTTGSIQIRGAVEGEHIVLGGNGLVSLTGVRAANEVKRNENENEVIPSDLAFTGFNSVINSISGFENVLVDEGSVTIKGDLSTTNLTVASDAQVVADSITVEEDIIDSGSIVVPVGKLTVTGKVDENPSLAFLGDVSQGVVGFVGNRALVDAFETGGISFTAQRQENNNYDYIVNAIELDSLTAVGKDVALGVGQSKTITVVADGALPEGASIEWSIGDDDVATITGNGMSATVKGKEIDNTTVTARIVDANGSDLGYGEANFDINVLGVDTVDSIGGDIGPDDNQVDLDTKKKNMEAGQVYTFMVRGNNDVENISVTSGDTNVATVALANGADSRGALYNITAVADGKTDITVTYQGKTSKIAVKVGGFQLDTSSKKMAPGQVYSVLAKNVPADQAGNVTLAYDSNIVDVVKVNDNYNGRGVLFNVTAKAIGETEVKVTHNGETETMAVNVVENTGRLTLDTASYTMPFGGNYTIGVKVEKNGRQLSGEEVRAMITSGELIVTDSRTGSIVTTEVQANGNVRVTGRQNEGTTYVQFIVMQNGQRVTHASVGVTVQNGATAGGSSVRSISQW